MKLTRIVEDYTSPDDKIVLVNDGNPIGFYFTHRKRWLQSEEKPLSVDMSKKACLISNSMKTETILKHNLVLEESVA